MECLIHDSKVAIDLFHNNFMEANPSKFQFILLKSFTSKEDLPDHILINNTRIERESQVKLLWVIIADKLKFNKHIDVLYKNIKRQINAPYRFRNVFNIEERELIYIIFLFWQILIIVRFVWHCIAKALISKKEKTEERALCFLLNDKTSSYSSLLEKSRQTTLHLKCI